MKTARDSGFEVASSQVLITNGDKQALLLAIATLVDDGDEVLVPTPYWVTYPEQVRLAGGTPVEVPTMPADGHRVTVDQLQAAFTPRTKALLFSSPSNPTGTTYSSNEMAAIGRWAALRGVWIVADEIYEHFVYVGKHVSMPVVAPEVRDRCLVTNGVSKTYAMTGWRVGWAIGPPEVVTRMAKLQSHQTGNVGNVAQVAALAAVSGPLDEVGAMRDSYERRRRLAHEVLSEIDGLTSSLPGGAFYIFLDASCTLGRAVGRRHVTSTVELCEVLLESTRVALVPGEAFGAPGGVRLSYALADDDLERGLARLHNALM
jgi:aspartate/methionine/tyrosine aminotransferase